MASSTSASSEAPLHQVCWGRLTWTEVNSQPLLPAEEVERDTGEGPQDIHVGGNVPEVEMTEGRQEHGYRWVACMTKSRHRHVRSCIPTHTYIHTLSLSISLLLSLPLVDWLTGHKTASYLLTLSVSLSLSLSLSRKSHHPHPLIHILSNQISNWILFVQQAQLKYISRIGSCSASVVR